jgi:hypothetical protein
MRRLFMRVFSAGLRSSFYPWAEAGPLKRPRSRWTRIPRYPEHRQSEFPKALKNLMLSMGMQGEVVYKGFLVIVEGQEYWWVQLHLYKNKEDDHKKMGL